MPKQTTKQKAEEKAEKKAEKKELAETYSVYNKFNQLARSYTIDNHGDKRKELAEEFATKIGGTVKEK